MRWTYIAVSVLVALSLVSVIGVVMVKAGAVQTQGRIAKFIDANGGLGNSDIRENDAGNVGMGVNPNSALKLLVNGRLGVRGQTDGGLGALVVSQEGRGPIATFRTNQSDVRLRVDAGGIDIEGSLEIAGQEVIDSSGRFLGSGVQTVNPLQIALKRWYAFNASGFRSNLAGGTILGLAFDGENMWVAKESANQVEKFRAADCESLGSFNVGSDPDDIVFDGQNIWVSNLASSSLTKIRSSDGSILGTFAVGPVPTEMAYDGTAVWVITFSNSSLDKVRVSDGAVVQTVALSGNLRGIEFDGTYLWVTNETSNTVTRVLASDGSVVDSFPTGAGPWGVLFDGTSIWVTNQSDNTVTKLRGSDGATLGTFATGSVPRSIGFDGTYIWVNNAFGTSVTRLRASDGSESVTFGLGGAPNGDLAFDGANMWTGISTTIAKM